jgi:hypothetical protein
MAILGLTNTNDIRDFLSRTERRRVLLQYPNGAAPLVGLLSTMEDEVTDGPYPAWWEHRFLERTTQTASIGASSGPFSPTTSDTASADPFNIVAGTVYRVRVAAGGVTYFKENDVIMIKGATLTSGTADIKGVITEVLYSAGNKIEFRALEAVTGVQNGTTNENVGLDVIVIGSANREGGSSTTSKHRYPTRVYNHTQIFRDAASFALSTIKEPLRYDKTGIYRDAMRQKSLDHMTSIENALLFGTLSAQNVTDANGESLEVRTMGGLEFFLQQWEKGNITNGGLYDYRPGGAAATLNSDYNKRIIDLAGATMSRATFESYLERVFAFASNKANEKLILCGSSFLTAVNQVYERQVMTTRSMGMKSEETYGINMTGIQTALGTVWLKSHPLFSHRSWMRNWAVLVDLPHMKLRPLQDRDTTLLKNRQLPDADSRKDEFLTELTAEIWYPESHMIFKNVAGITAS